jgi:predicted ATP-grasp superfamily ATP-dependent carboligase
MKKVYPVIILGDHISAYGAIRGLSINKIPIYMVSPLGEGVALKSRYIKKSIILDPEDGKFISKLDDWIKKVVGPCAVLMVAGEDRYLDVLSKRYTELSGDIKVTFPDWEIVKYVREKRCTYKIARDIGIPIPKTFYITCKSELETLLSDKNVTLDYPLFMKAEKSGIFYKQYKIKGVICYNAQEVIAYYLKYGGFEGGLLLQELISSEYEKIFTVLMVLNRNSKPIGLIINQKKRSVGKFMSGTFVISDWSNQLLDYSLKLVNKIGYYGYAGLQFKYDSNNCDFKLLEINGRISMSNSLALKCGVNLPYLMYKEAIENPMPEIKLFKQTYPNNIIWWNLISDIISYFRWNKQFLNLSKYIKSLIGRGYVIEPFYWLDPYPGFFYSFHTFSAILKKYLSFKKEK